MLSSDEQVRILLRTGIAEPGIATSSGRMFEEDAIEAVRVRPAVDPAELARVCPHGLLVVRLPRSARIDVTGAWWDVARDVTRAFAQQRQMTPLSAALTGVRIRAWGPLPFVATFLGYVVLVADLVELAQDGPDLVPAGPWAAAVENRRLHTSPGGRPAFVWTPPVGRIDAIT